MKTEKESRKRKKEKTMNLCLVICFLTETEKMQQEDLDIRALLYFSVFIFTQVYLINKIKNKFYGNVFGLIMPLFKVLCLLAQTTFKYAKS